MSEPTVTADAAHGALVATLSGDGRFGLSVADDYYRDTDEATLGAELGRLARLLVARRLEAQREEDRRSESRPPSFPAGSRYAREIDEFNQAVLELEDSGESPGGDIRISAVGLGNVVVDIEAGTLARWSPRTFEAEAAEAADRLLADRMRAVWRLRIAHFAD